MCCPSPVHVGVCDRRERWLPLSCMAVRERRQLEWLGVTGTFDLWTVCFSTNCYFRHTWMVASCCCTYNMLMCVIPVHIKLSVLALLQHILDIYYWPGNFPHTTISFFISSFSSWSTPKPLFVINKSLLPSPLPREQLILTRMWQFLGPSPKMRPRIKIG